MKTPMRVDDATLIAVLVRLAQRDLRGDSALSEEAGFARLKARIAREHSVWPKRALLASVALAVGAVGGVAFIQSPSRVLTFDVIGSPLGESARIDAKIDTLVRFSDGSAANLLSGTEARIQKLTEHGAELVLIRGSMRVQIAKKPRASWTVAAGPYEVHVTGTAFEVSWSNETQAFDVRMQTGAVVVVGPLAPSGTPLKAGQHLFGAGSTGRLTIENSQGVNPLPTGSETVAVLPSAAVPASRVEGRREPQGVPPAPLASPVTLHAGSETRSWTRQVAEGHFDTVLEQAERRGLERTLSSGALEELSALADAARYSGQPALAKRTLLAERQRFPGSRPALDAAFFLGRIAEDSGTGGIEWYERYVSESPRGAYASQAFGRRMMLLYKQRGAAAAAPAATDYLARYPNGPYAVAARKLAEESSSAHSP